MSDHLKPLNGWQLLRSLVPPWGQRLDDPLLRYGVHRHRRAGGHPWVYLFIVIVLALGVGINLALASIVSVRSASPRTLMDETVTILLVGLWGMSVLGHWRLLLATIGRSSAAISQKRERGDWDLIFITPVSKSRWYQAQLTALGWQIFPLVRRLMILQCLLTVIALPALIVLQIEGGYGMPTSVYALEILILAPFMIIEPIFSAGIFASSALLESSLRKNVWVAFLNGLVAVYLVRLVMSIVLVVGGFLVLIGVTELAAALGLIDTGTSIDHMSEEEVKLLLFYLGVAVIASAFIIEWIPAGLAVVLTEAPSASDSLVVFTALLLTFLTTYVIMPLILMHLLAARSVKRLSRPDD